jgi:acyl CoA:acetate/3-ketoacid CoA transferase
MTHRPGYERRVKIVSAAEAARCVRDGATVATSGLVGVGFAESIAIALEKRFLGEDPQSPRGKPSGLTLVFTGTFTAGDLEIAVEGGKLRIVREGRARKFVQAVEQLTYCADVAVRRGQPALYVTERCVFRLTSGGLELVEIAPGIDLHRDVLAQMESRPSISRELRVMDGRIFAQTPMGLRGQLLAAA